MYVLFLQSRPFRTCVLLLYFLTHPRVRGVSKPLVSFAVRSSGLVLSYAFAVSTLISHRDEGSASPPCVCLTVLVTPRKEFQFVARCSSPSCLSADFLSSTIGLIRPSNVDTRPPHFLTRVFSVAGLAGDSERAWMPGPESLAMQRPLVRPIIQFAVRMPCV